MFFMSYAINKCKNDKFGGKKLNYLYMKTHSHNDSSRLLHIIAIQLFLQVASDHD